MRVADFKCSFFFLTGYSCRVTRRMRIDCDWSRQRSEIATKVNRKTHSRRAWSRDACLQRSSKVKDNTFVDNKGYWLMERKVWDLTCDLKADKISLV